MVLKCASKIGVIYEETKKILLVLKMSKVSNPYGDCLANEKVVDAIIKYFIDKKGYLCYHVISNTLTI